MKTRRKQALEDWDRRRERDGLGKWDVIYHSSSRKSFPRKLIRLPCISSSSFIIDKDTPDGPSSSHEVKPQTRKSSTIYIPTLSPSSLVLPPPVPNSDDDDDDEIEDWNEHMNDLFEWVGMACLGAQR